MANRPLFEHRHFAWLANWAVHKLSQEQKDELCYRLAETNENFNRERFMIAAKGEPLSLDKPRNNITPYGS